jgi:Domain of unknown function (DUF4351)
MQDYDAALKALLPRIMSGALGQWIGIEVAQWHNVELKTAATRRVDLLGESRDGRMIQIELQSTNDAEMGLRMLEYAVAIYRNFGKRPEQVVVYVGYQPLRMTGQFWEFDFRIIDIREFESAPLLESPVLEDNVISVLLRTADRRQTVRKILRRIARASPAEGRRALEALFVLARLRHLGPLLNEETAKMPVLIDWMNDEVIGPRLRQALEEGEQRGEERERRLLVRQIEKRFGPIPEWAQARLDAMSLDQLEETGLRLFDATTLEELLA